MRPLTPKMATAPFGAALLLSLVLVLSASCPALAVPEDENAPSDQAGEVARLNAICAKTICRKSGPNVTLRTEGENFSEPRPPYPYVDLKGALIIFPGETIVLGFKRNGTNLGKPQLLSVTDADGPVDLGSAVAPDSNLETLTFAFEQEDGKQDMNLKVTNRVDAFVRYSAVMHVPTPQGIGSKHTSTCALFKPAKTLGFFGGFETWPHPIAMLVITDIHAMPEDKPNFNCE